MKLVLLKCTACLALALLWTPLGRVQAEVSPPPETAEYTRTIDAALEEYRVGHFEEARGLFAHAHTLEPSARTLRGLGMVEFELRHYVRAAELLEASLESTEKPLTPEQREMVEALLARTRHLVARYRLDVTPAEAELELDGQPATLTKGALAVTAGEHALHVAAPGYVARDLKLDARGGEEQVLRVELMRAAASADAEPPPLATPPMRVTRPHRTLGIVLSSLGGAALAAGATLGALALMKESDASTSDGPDADGARSLALGADVSLGLGAASAVTGLVLLLWKKSEQPAHAGLSLESVAPSLRVRF